MESMYHVILAGGSGSRFWPKSRQDTPKQLLKIIGDESMIRLTYKRLQKISKADNILIVASKTICKKIQIEIPEIPENNYIIEPSGKNTAPAIGLAAINILKRNQNAIMGVYPSDHLIMDEKKFKAIITIACEIIFSENALITIGIKPTYPATGYGYIQLKTIKENKLKGVYRVKKFVEKPTEKVATKYVSSGEFLWNGGIFLWKAKTILEEIKTFMPNLHKSLNSLYNAIDESNYKMMVKKQWNLIESESIDYGILEKSQNVFTIEADFKWSDLGSWKSLFSILTKNSDQNYYEGDIISVKSKNNLVISPNRLIAMVGIKNLTIINLDDATLIVPHENAEEVKDIVNMLKSLNRKEYL